MIATPGDAPPVEAAHREHHDERDVTEQERARARRRIDRPPASNATSPTRHSDRATTPAIVASSGHRQSPRSTIAPMVVRGLEIDLERAMVLSSRTYQLANAAIAVAMTTIANDHQTIALTMALMAGDDHQRQHEPAESFAVHVLADTDTRAIDRPAIAGIVTAVAINTFAGDLARGDEQRQAADVADREDGRRSWPGT